MFGDAFKAKRNSTNLSNVISECYSVIVNVLNYCECFKLQLV